MSKNGTDETITKYKRLKFTKPQLFKTAILETQNQRQRMRPWHDKKYDLTDYFNYGYNEHTLQIYAHKITKMCEQYNEQSRPKYIERLEKSSHGSLLDQCFSRSNIAMRELIPIDLGGLCLPVDELLLDISDPFALFFEPRHHNHFHTDINSQNLYSGEQMIHQNSLIGELRKKTEDRIQQIFNDKISDNLYLFDEAAKVLPQQPKILPSFMITNSLLTNNLAYLSMQKTEAESKQTQSKSKPSSRSRSRQKDKKHKKEKKSK